MGFDSIAVGKVRTPFHAMMEDGILQEGKFAFYLGQADGKDGELILGGIDEKHYAGDIHWVPVVNPTYWTVALDAVTLDGASYAEENSIVTGTGATVAAPKGKVAIIDSGTSLIAGPCTVCHDCCHSCSCVCTVSHSIVLYIMIHSHHLQALRLKLLQWLLSSVQ